MAKKEAPGQMNLFGGLEPPARPAGREAGPAVRPAKPREEIAALAAQLPDNVYLGTSSWSFPGWADLLYDGGYRESELAREGLRAYAQHPLFRAVGLDKSYYAPLSMAENERLASQTPADFRFLVKAYDGVTTPFYTERNAPRDVRPGALNPRFLDASFTADEVVRPYVEGLRGRAGALVFQFSPMELRKLGGPGGFIDRLADFGAKLPPGPAYAVEIRNRELLGDAWLEAYVAALAAGNMVHCYNVHPNMPSPAEQAERVPLPANATVCAVRWMLNPAFRYDAAVERYAPFNRLVDPDPANRSALADLIAAAARQPIRVITSINNKAEGSSPLSCVELAKEIIARSKAEFQDF
jgi:uncharacterized protein YecE (DUF72 family)